MDEDFLALMVEEDPAAIATTLSTVLDNSLVSAQATRRGMDIEPIRSLFTNGSNRILDRVPDTGRRNAFSDTGLSLASCELLAQEVDNRSDTLVPLLRNAQVADVGNLCELFVRACTKLTETQPSNELTADYARVLERWLAGGGVGQLWAEPLAGV